jgi:hypothetical protein
MPVVLADIDEEALTQAEASCTQAEALRQVMVLR